MCVCVCVCVVGGECVYVCVWVGVCVCVCVKGVILTILFSSVLCRSYSPSDRNKMT